MAPHINLTITSIQKPGLLWVLDIRMWTGRPDLYYISLLYLKQSDNNPGKVSGFSFHDLNLTYCGIHLAWKNIFLFQ
jgi:hypothetical protein